MFIGAGARPDGRRATAVKEKNVTTLGDFPKFSKMSGAAPRGSKGAGTISNVGVLSVQLGKKYFHVYISNRVNGMVCLFMEVLERRSDEEVVFGR